MAAAGLLMALKLPPCLSHTHPPHPQTQRVVIPHLSPPALPSSTPQRGICFEGFNFPPTPPSCRHHPQGVVKLADFGVSAKLGELEEHRDELQQHVVGTPYWMAPEVRIAPRSRAKPWPKP